jgi:hypothetical protein
VRRERHLQRPGFLDARDHHTNRFEVNRADGGVDLALEAVDDVFGGQRLPIPELHAGADVVDPGQRRRMAVGLREIGNDLHRGVDPEEAVAHLREHLVFRRVPVLRGIERDRFSQR